MGLLSSSNCINYRLMNITVYLNSVSRSKGFLRNAFREKIFYYNFFIDGMSWSPVNAFRIQFKIAVRLSPPRRPRYFFPHDFQQYQSPRVMSFIRSKNWCWKLVRQKISTQDLDSRVLSRINIFSPVLVLYVVERNWVNQNALVRWWKKWTWSPDI